MSSYRWVRNGVGVGGGAITVGLGRYFLFSVCLCLSVPLPVSEAELDATSTKISRKATATVHKGRFIGIVSRVSPVRGLIELPDAPTVKGAPPPVDTKAQVAAALKGRLGQDHVVFTYAAPAYCKPLASVGAKHAAVNRGKRQFARFHKWPLAEMSSQLRALAAKRAAQKTVVRNKKRAGKTTATVLKKPSSSFRCTVSNNKVEGFFSVLKRHCRQTGGLRSNTTRTDSKLLSAAWQTDHPGLVEACEALQKIGFLKQAAEAVSVK